MNIPKQFYKTLTGWVTDKNDVIACAIYDHKEVLFEQLKDIPLISGYLQEIEDAAEGCEALAEIGEHPEWHSYEMAKDENEYLIIQYAYSNGWIRIAPYNGFGRAGGKPAIAFASQRKTIMSKMDIINRIVDDCSATLGKEYLKWFDIV